MPLAIFDLDGVIYLGTRLLPHATETVRRLERARWSVSFATNGTTSTRDDYRKRLRSLGLDVDAARIVSGSSATAAHLARRANPPRDVLLVGTDGFRAELRRAGIAVRDRTRELVRPGPPWIERSGARAAAPPDTVVVGLDPEFDYAVLAEAQWAVMQGAELVAGNRDPAFPGEGRTWPGAGPIVAAIEVATGRAALCIGKPEPFLFEEAIRGVGPGAHPVVVIGDSTDSDVVAAHRAGAVAVLVLTGMTTERELDMARGEAVPDRVIRGLDELFDLPEFVDA